MSSLAEVMRVMEEIGRRLDAGLPLDDLVVTENSREIPGRTPTRVRSRRWVLWTGAAAALVVAMMLLGRSRDQGASVRKAAVPAPVVNPVSAPQSIETPTGPMELIQEQPAFYVDKYEVTNAAYLRFCDVTSRPRPKPPTWDPRYFEHLDHPVAGVSWQDARAFAEWAGKRLLSRTEWEKAAMGDRPREYPWGNWYEPGTANLRDSRRRSPAPVGWFAFDFSPFGVQDLAGNVAEWVGNESPAVRGGSFRSSPEEARIRYAGAAPDPDVIGFRCAADVKVGIALRVVEPR
jgi:hypothetical protein